MDCRVHSIVQSRTYIGARIPLSTYLRAGCNKEVRLTVAGDEYEDPALAWARETASRKGSNTIRRAARSSKQ